MQDDEFVHRYDSFVRSIVQHTRAQVGFEGDFEDLVASGYEGLLEARARFDPSRGVHFRTFAYYRVRGAVIDGIRRMAYLPRRAYARLKAAEAVDREGEPRLAASAQGGMPAHNTEGALRALDGVLGKVAAAYVVSATVACADEARDPEQSVLDRERRESVRRALETLPDPERFLIRGHYLEGRSFDSLATELGLSKSWVSRLHSRALGRLREAFEPK